MKPRKVIVTLELLTDAPLSLLKMKDSWSWYILAQDEIVQIQVNVVKEEKKTEANR